jgi:hypothetical protein
MAKPRKATTAEAKIVEGVVVLRTEDGAVAVVPKDEVCKLVERYNLVIKGIQCK